MLRGEYFPTPCTQICQNACLCSSILRIVKLCTVQLDLRNKHSAEGQKKTSTALC